MKILIIEDDAFYRKMYKKKIELAGYVVEVAENGQEGLEKMRTFKPDLVFMDLMMPKMDGFDAITKAKSEDEIKDIPIIALTNLSTADDAEKIVARGALKVLVKSNVEPKDIVEEAEKTLKEIGKKS